MTPEGEQLMRLYSAVTHYDRMGWLDIPEVHRWKFDALLVDVRAALGLQVGDRVEMDSGD